MLQLKYGGGFMSQNRKILKVGIIIILAILVICMSLSSFLKLNKPVFLSSYVELELPVFDSGYYGDSQFELRYITNANDNRVVNDIEFIEIPDLYAYVSEYGFNTHIFDTFNRNSNNIPGEIKGMYSIRTVNIQINAYEIKAPIDELHITKAKIHFSNGDAITTDIGHVVLLDSKSSGNYLDFKSSNSSSYEIDNTLFELKKDMTLLKVDSPLLNNIEEIIDIQIDGIDYKDVNGIKYSKGDQLRTSSKLEEQQNPLLKYNFYNIRPRLYFEDSEGKIVTDNFDGFYIKEHNFELLDIIKFLRAKGEI